MKFVLITTLMLSLAGCVTAPPRENTTKTFQSSKKKDALHSSVLANLMAAGYMVRVSDKAAGIIVTEPKEYRIIKRGVFDVLWPLRTTIQLNVSDSQITAQYKQDCLSNPGSTWGECQSYDSEAMAVLPDHERNLDTLLNKSI